jgi:hypothetical protein
MTAFTRVHRRLIKLLKESQERCGSIQGIQRILEPVIDAESWDRAQGREGPRATLRCAFRLPCFTLQVPPAIWRAA